MNTLTNTFTYGYVVGLFASSVADSPDEDRLPDLKAPDIKITFTRSKGQYVHYLPIEKEGAGGVMVSHTPINAAVMPNGHLTGDIDTSGRAKPDAKPGIWLVVGQYKVNFGGFFPEITIDVKAEHTEENPMDVSTAIGYVPLPGQVVYTLAIPRGGEPGQVYGWNGMGVDWFTPPTGPQGLPGEPGPQGERGPAGPKGDKGDAGLGVVGGRVFVQSTSPEDPQINDVWIN